MQLSLVSNVDADLFVTVLMLNWSMLPSERRLNSWDFLQIHFLFSHLNWDSPVIMRKLTHDTFFPSGCWRWPQSKGQLPSRNSEIGNGVSERSSCSSIAWKAERQICWWYFRTIVSGRAQRYTYWCSWVGACTALCSCIDCTNGSTVDTELSDNERDDSDEHAKTVDFWIPAFTKFNNLRIVSLLGIHLKCYEVHYYASHRKFSRHFKAKQNWIINYILR